MVTSREVLEKYLALRAEMDAIYNDVLLPRAMEICARVHGFEPKSAYITKAYISVDDGCDSDSAYSIPVDWMFDENWEVTIDAHLEKQRHRWERESRRLTERANRATEERERAELAKLLAKYPPQIQKAD
jgi:hypothetical protein